MITPATYQPTVFLTGATGLLGHHLLADLLARGCRCVVLLRGARKDAIDRLSELLSTLDIDLASRMQSGQVVITLGDLAEGLSPPPVSDIDTIVHAAGSTRFSTDAAGDPDRTNAIGTRNLLAWAEAHCINTIHHVSTAYVGGSTRGPIGEAVFEQPPPFHNDYEQSKWHAEQACLDWSRPGDRRLAIYRPSIIVGDFRRGRTTAFNGVYLLFRAADLVAKMAADDDGFDRYALPLDIKARATDRVNLIPVDHVAAVIAASVCDADGVRGVFNLVHPDPPRYDLIRQVIEQAFDIAGGRFVGSNQPAAKGRASAIECAFEQIIESIHPYLADASAFDRQRADSLERRLGLHCPRIDAAFLFRLVRYGRECNWGRGRPAPTAADPGCAAYFEQFLPERLPRSQVARMHGLNAVVRFVIDDVKDGQWVCRFVNGQLEQMRRGDNGLREEFAYRTNRAHFWKAVSGDMDPQEIFLGGHAEVIGDAEKALKLAMILHAFSREFPCRPEMFPAPSTEVLA